MRICRFWMPNFSLSILNLTPHPVMVCHGGVQVSSVAGGLRFLPRNKMLSVFGKVCASTVVESGKEEKQLTNL